MRICDICKKNNAKYNTMAVVKDDGTTQELELCGRCYQELVCREDLHMHQAYEETVKAITGEIPRKFHWWNMFSW
jgi:protein-arginine kinase activator protein McsA